MKTIHRHDMQADQVRHLQAAMVHRAVIQQAKGIIMAERRCSPDEAFAVLVKISQDSNREVHDIAADLAHRTTHTPEPTPITASTSPGASPGTAVTHMQLTADVDQDGTTVIGVAGELVMDTADETRGGDHRRTQRRPGDPYGR